MAWKRFRKDGVAMISLCFIGVAVLAGILAYLITPDETPFANKQFLELGTLKPGTKVLMLSIDKQDSVAKLSWWRKMIAGQKSRKTEIPLNRYEIRNGVLHAETYTGIEGERGEAIVMETGRKGFSIDEKRYWLGTDRYGRDVLSMLVIGTRVSLSVGFISVLISLVLGISLGAIAGFFRGWADQLIMWLINVVWSIPTLLLVIAITFALGRGFWQVFIAVGLTMWVEVARIVRGQILGIREKEYVEAARALGFSNTRIIIRHILPNAMSPVIVISAANFASAILLEAGLSFLGIGVQPPMPSWGSMIRDNYPYIILDAAYLAILPGLAIMLMVLAFMLVGNGLRDALDVKAK